MENKAHNLEINEKYDDYGEYDADDLFIDIVQAKCDMIQKEKDY
jgi:hypothetical protein